jgi:hypothetical protein
MNAMRRYPAAGGRRDRRLVAGFRRRFRRLAACSGGTIPVRVAPPGSSTFTVTGVPLMTGVARVTPPDPFDAGRAGARSYQGEAPDSAPVPRCYVALAGAP